MDRIYEDIDNLSFTQSHSDLVSALQQVLGRMAYFISQSEGVVLDHHEDWHEKFANILAGGAGAPRHGAVTPRQGSAAARDGAAPRKAGAAPRKASAAPRDKVCAPPCKDGAAYRRDAHARRAEKRKKRRGAGSPATSAKKDAASEQERRAPLSQPLCAIFDGSHPSLAGVD